MFSGVAPTIIANPKIVVSHTAIVENIYIAFTTATNAPHSRTNMKVLRMKWERELSFINSHVRVGG